MVITRTVGGLGNQMFQYAFGRRLASYRQVPLKLDVSKFQTYTRQRYGLHHLNIAADIASEAEIRMLRGRARRGVFLRLASLAQKVRSHNKKTYFVERSFGFDPNVFLLSGNVYLEGHWQSERYFKEIEDPLREEFAVRTKPEGANALLLEKIMRTSAVSLHIRRGDYVSDSKTRSVHGTLQIDYYQNAIRLLADQVEDPHLFVFSDDPEWASDNLNSEFPTEFVAHNNASKNYEDLRLMSSCKHHIIANSTFSWWAAWLCTSADKIVFAPRRWFEASYVDTSDLIPNAWKRI